MTYTLDEVIEMAERTDKLIERSEFHKDATEYLKQYREMRWHYPSKGELPDDNEIVLLSIKGRVWKRMEFGQWNGQFFVANDSDYSTKEILAWQYIVPPKEEA